ncbi:hypothetical protein BH11PAT4_BH11PAT4_0730 [soil metagenome]
MKGTGSNATTWVELAKDTTWAEKLPGNIDVLVLSLGCTLDRTNSHLSTSSVTSIEAGISWYKKKKQEGVKKVALVAVGTGYHQIMPHYEFDLMMDIARASDVPEEDLFGENHSFNTPLNAVCIAEALKLRRVGEIILTCDPLHAKRAAATFQKVFGEYGISTKITVMRGAMPEYGNSSKWFLRKAYLWKAWNILGRILLPLHVYKIRKALHSR